VAKGDRTPSPCTETQPRQLKPLLFPPLTFIPPPCQIVCSLLGFQMDRTLFFFRRWNGTPWLIRPPVEACPPPPGTHPRGRDPLLSTALFSTVFCAPSGLRSRLIFFLILTRFFSHLFVSTVYFPRSTKSVLGGYLLKNLSWAQITARALEI